MPLPKNPESRKKVAQAMAALMKLPPARRKEILRNELDKRSLEVPQKLAQ